MKTSTALAVVVACLLLAGARIYAAPITVTNGDFESPAQASDDTFTNTFSIPSWTLLPGGAGGCGVERLATSHFAAAQPRSIDGNQVAYINGDTRTFSQTLAPTVTVNTTYTISLWIGDRNDTALLGYAFGLYQGTGVATAALVSETNAVTPPDGTWVHRTLSYTVLPGDPTIGQALSIRFGSSGSSGQTVFDSFTVDATPVPEPSMGATLIGAATLLRRSRCR